MESATTVNTDETANVSISAWNRAVEDRLNLPTRWTSELKKRSGATNLEGLPVYFDFQWRVVFKHGRTTLKNGKSLASAVKRDCPSNLHPAILLTTRDDHDEGPIVTSSHFVVVVHVQSFLDQGSPDAVATYFARVSKTRVTSLSKLREIWDKPEVRDFVLNNLTSKDIQDWVTTNAEALRSLAETVRTRAFEDLLRVLEIDDVVRILNWFAKGTPKCSAAEVVARIRDDDLPTFHTLFGVARLKKVVDKWKSQISNASEEYWQQEFTTHSFALAHLFSFPVIVQETKANVGGKSFDNKGSNLVDFLLKNELTNNAVLLEIKTPATLLLAGKYRNVVNVSSELSGACLQVANYRQSLVEHYASLSLNYRPRQLTPFDPPAVVIIGSTNQLKDDGTESSDGPDKMRSFELFRAGQRRIEVITFDELFRRLENLLTALSEIESDKDEFADVELPAFFE